MKMSWELTLTFSAFISLIAGDTAGSWLYQYTVGTRVIIEYCLQLWRHGSTKKVNGTIHVTVVVSIETITKTTWDQWTVLYSVRVNHVCASEIKQNWRKNLIDGDTRARQMTTDMMVLCSNFVKSYPANHCCCIKHKHCKIFTVIWMYDFISPLNHN